MRSTKPRQYQLTHDMRVALSAFRSPATHSVTVSLHAGDAWYFIEITGFDDSFWWNAFLEPRLTIQPDHSGHGFQPSAVEAMQDCLVYFSGRPRALLGREHLDEPWVGPFGPIDPNR